MIRVKKMSIKFHMPKLLPNQIPNLVVQELPKRKGLALVKGRALIKVSSFDKSTKFTTD